MSETMSRSVDDVEIVGSVLLWLPLNVPKMPTRRVSPDARPDRLAAAGADDRTEQKRTLNVDETDERMLALKAAQRVGHSKSSV